MESEGPAGPEGDRPTAPPAGGGGPAQEAAQAGKWGLAPIRWGGNMADEFRWTRATDQPKRFQHVQIGSMRGASYVWQPWIAQVTGSLGFVSGTERTDGDRQATGAGDSGSRSTTRTGNGSVALFPVSRFPFVAALDVNDSRASGQLTASDYVSKRLSLRQSYQPAEGPARFMGSFDRSTLNSASFGTDTVDAWNGSYSTNFGEQGMEFTGSRSTNQRSNGDAASAFDRLSLRHTYRPEEDFSLESLVSYSDSDLTQRNVGITNRNKARYYQGNTFFTWRPDEDLPLYVTGGGRFFAADAEANGTANQSQSLSGNIGATYNYSRNLTLAGGASVAQARSGSVGALVSAQNAGATYVGDPIKFGNFSYDWNAGTTVNNQFGGMEGGRRGLSGQLGHGLTRQYAFSPNSGLGLNLGQTVGVNADSLGGRSQSLSHTAGASWRLTRDEGLAAFLSVTGADTRSSGAAAGSFQFVGFQLNGQWRIGRYSLLNGNLSLQLSRQSTGQATRPVAGQEPGPTPAPAVRPGWTTHAFGNLSYQNMRLFGTPGLRYTASYSVNTLQMDNRLLGNVDAQRDQIGQSLEQRLDYRIGRLDVRLSAQVVEFDGKKNALIFLRAGRDFGDF